MPYTPRELSLAARDSSVKICDHRLAFSVISDV